MSAEIKQIYEFGEFRLDPKERILLRGDQAVELTPKGFELLSFLVENHGRLLGKDELMSKIWADSFVEDSNLTFNIRQLRKILDDDAHSPKYIKTVRQHGYRFIADVKQIPASKKPKQDLIARSANGSSQVDTIAPNGFKPTETLSPENQITRPKRKSFLVPILIASVVLLVGAAVIASWYLRNGNLEPTAPVLSASFASERLSTNGKVHFAVISPDGKNVVYLNGLGSDKQSIWLRNLEDGSNIEIIPASDHIYGGLALSPDGKLLYFVRRTRQTDEPSSIYRISIFGGIPQKIVSDTEALVSVSPDAKQISFVRHPRREDENYSLWIADVADGKNERKLASCPRPLRIGDHRFSPDGRSIAFSIGQSENSSNEFGLKEVDLESGKVREFSAEKFFNIKNLAWLPDKSGLLITAARVPNRNFRIWQVSAVTGETAPLTKDSESYSILTLDKDATKIVATNIRQDFHLRLFNLENSSVSRNLTAASAVTFAPNGRIYFSSGMSGNDEIWSINQDGGNQRQLTNNPGDEAAPVVSPDGNTVFFESNRTGAAHIWRMNPDGSNQTQVTQKEGGFPIFVSSDGEWVYYHHGINRTLWRVSVKSGEEQLVLNVSKGIFAISPDASQVAFSNLQGDERILTIVSLADGQTIKIFRLADPKFLLRHISWMKDGKNLAYISANRDNENNILWLQPLDAEKPRQIVTLGDEELGGFGLPIAPDDKTFAVAQGEWLHDAVLLKGLR